MSSLPALLFLAILRLVPLQPGESFAAQHARYSALALAFALEAGRLPVVEGDPWRTGLLLVAIGLHESHFRASVHDGRDRGDDGASWGVLQRQLGAGRDPAGRSGPELVADERACAASALELLSFCARVCGRGVLAMLQGYGSGACTRGRKAAPRRVATYDRLRATFLPVTHKSKPKRPARVRVGITNPADGRRGFTWKLRGTTGIAWWDAAAVDRYWRDAGMTAGDFGAMLRAVLHGCEADRC